MDDNEKEGKEATKAIFEVNNLFNDKDFGVQTRMGVLCTLMIKYAYLMELQKDEFISGISGSWDISQSTSSKGI